MKPFWKTAKGCVPTYGFVLYTSFTCFKMSCIEKKRRKKAKRIERRNKKLWRWASVMTRSSWNLKFSSKIYMLKTVWCHGILLVLNDNPNSFFLLFFCRIWNGHCSQYLNRVLSRSDNYGDRQINDEPARAGGGRLTIHPK